MMNPIDRVQWQEGPPDTTASRYYPLVRPTVYQPILALIVSKAILWVPTHYIDKQTAPCMKEEHGCDGCRAGFGQRWYGYAACVGKNTGKIGILEITPEAYRCCPRLADKERGTRGVHVKLYRRGKYRNAPVVCEIQGEAGAIALPVPEFDIRPHLARIWGMLPTKGMRRDGAHLEMSGPKGGDS